MVNAAKAGPKSWKLIRPEVEKVVKDVKRHMNDLETPLLNPEVLKPISQYAKSVRSSAVIARTRNQLALKRLEREREFAKRMLEVDERYLAEERAILDKEREIRRKRIEMEALYAEKLLELKKDECALLRKANLNRNEESLSSAQRDSFSKKDDAVESERDEDVDDDAEEYEEKEESLSGIHLSRTTSPRSSITSSVLPQPNPPPRPVPPSASGEESLLTANQLAAGKMEPIPSLRPVSPSAAGKESLLAANQIAPEIVRSRPEQRPVRSSATGKDQLTLTASQISGIEVQPNPSPRPVCPSATGEEELTLTASQVAEKLQPNPIPRPVWPRATGKGKLFLIAGQVAAKEEHSNPPLISVLPRATNGEEFVLTASQTGKEWPKNLPVISCDPEEMSTCFRSFMLANKTCGKMNVDNINYLRDCLHGEARERVATKLRILKSMLSTIEDPSWCYEWSHMIVEGLNGRTRRLAEPVQDDSEAWGYSGEDKMQLCDNVAAVSLRLSHLDNLIDKLSIVHELQWVSHQRAYEQATLKEFSEFVDALVAGSDVDIWRVMKASLEKEKLREKGHMDAHSSDLLLLTQPTSQSGSCCISIQP